MRVTTAGSATPPRLGRTRSHRVDAAVTVAVATARCASLRPSGGGGEAPARAERRNSQRPDPAWRVPTPAADAAEGPWPPAAS